MPRPWAPEGVGCEYVLPLRWDGEQGLDELTHYLLGLPDWVDVTVVDGSPGAVFRAHERAWAGRLRHLRPQPWPGANGKVAGVVTGVRRARHERVVVADDDVRYDGPTLASVVALLDRADLVRPQNVFTEHPWHARWDTGRTLLNRALGHDFPGTFALRRSTFVQMGGYDGNVLFENLELSRTVRACGGTELCADHLFVGRRAPTTERFLRQRVRQAYDDLAQPVRLAVELSILPGLVLLARWRPRWLPLLLVAVPALAERGRRRAGGAAVFPAMAAWWALPWLLERGAGVWVAVAWRAAGGVPYAGARLSRAATTPAQLRRSFSAGRSPLDRGAGRPLTQTRPPLHTRPELHAATASSEGPPVGSPR
jgi:hypothetical protein